MSWKNWDLVIRVHPFISGVDVILFTMSVSSSPSAGVADGGWYTVQ